MNDPEVTMSNALTNTNLIAHEKALEAAGIAISLGLRVPAPLKSIADQVIRSTSSVPANLAEGHGRSGRDRLHFWRIAYASAKEVDSHLRLLARIIHKVTSRGRRGAVHRGVCDPRGAEAYLTVRRAPRGEQTPLGAAYRRPQ
jgi:four helix bundle protein